MYAYVNKPVCTHSTVTITILLSLQVVGCSSDDSNSRTESTEQILLSSVVPLSYMSPSDAKNEYNQQKLASSYTHCTILTKYIFTHAIESSLRI